MNENLNLAEILKDCPKGMELDCLLFENPVKYEGLTKSETYQITIKTLSGEFFYITNKGYLYDRADSKCIIFPKGKTTWEGFVPPCDFKDGDVIYVETKTSRWVSIFKEDTENKIVTYADCNLDTRRLCGTNDFEGVLCLKRIIREIRPATEEEKEKLFKAIKEHGYTWNAVTKTLEKLVEPKFKAGDKIQQKNQHEVCLVSEVCDNHYLLDEKDIALPFFAQDDWELAPDKFDITTLKPFDRVLVRSTLTEKWHIDFFEKIDNVKPIYDTIGMSSGHCIPYNDETKHLLGRVEMEPEFYQVDEYE